MLIHMLTSNYLETNVMSNIEKSRNDRKGEHTTGHIVEPCALILENIEAKLFT